MKGYNLQQYRYTLQLVAISLQNTEIVYNTIPYPVVLQCLSFIGEIPWENATVNPIPWVRKMVGQQTSQNIFSGVAPLNPKVGERVYSTLGVQTWLNNISGSGRLGSTTNTPTDTFQWLRHLIKIRKFIDMECFPSKKIRPNIIGL